MEDCVEYSNAVYARTSDAHAAIVSGILNSKASCGECTPAADCRVCNSVNGRLVVVEEEAHGSIKRHIVQPPL